MILPGMNSGMDRDMHVARDGIRSALVGRLVYSCKNNTGLIPLPYSRCNSGLFIPGFYIANANSVPLDTKGGERLANRQNGQRPTLGAER